MSENELIVPREQFINHVLALAVEGEVHWHCSEEVREQIDYSDLANPNYVEDVSIDEEKIEIYSKLSAKESERVARASHWQPAEYKNHKVTLHVMTIMDWPEDQYQMPQTMVEVDQEGGKPTPPDPEPYDI